MLAVGGVNPRDGEPLFRILVEPDGLAFVPSRESDGVEAPSFLRNELGDVRDETPDNADFGELWDLFGSATSGSRLNGLSVGNCRFVP